MALERVPADIRKDGGVARMSDPKVINIIYFFTVLVIHYIENKRKKLPLIFLIACLI